MLAFCRAEYGAVQLWRGRWGDAEAMLEASVEDFSRSRPAWVGGPLVGLAELRRRQGRPARRSGCSIGRARPPAQLCRARLALDAGETLQAVELLERLLRQLPPDRRLDRAPALELLVHARTARGELEEAAAARRGAARGGAAGRHGADARRAPTSPRACSPARRGDHERARALLEDAVDRFERSGAPFEAARARIELATSLVALGRADAAEREAAAARRAPARAGRGRRSRRARRSSPLPSAAACRRAASRRGSARSCACSPRASRTARSPSGWWSASTRSTATSRTSCASSASRRAPPRPPTRSAAGLLDAARIARTGHPARRAKMAGPGEVAGARAYGGMDRFRACRPRRCARSRRWRRAGAHREPTPRPTAAGDVGARRLPPLRHSRRSGGSARCSSRRAASAAGQRVLDVAAGTGNVAIRAAEAGARRRRLGPHAGELRGGPARGARRAASSSSGSRPTPRRCRSPTASSTSSPRRPARSSRRTIRRWPTSSCASAGRAARSGC